MPTCQLSNPHRGWDLGLLNFPLTLLALSAGIALLIQRRFDLGLFTLGNVLLIVNSTDLQANSRYLLGIFPVYLVAAVWLSRRSREWEQGVLTASAGLMALLSLLVAMGINAPKG